MSFSLPMAAANASGTDHRPVFHRANATTTTVMTTNRDRFGEPRPPLGQPVERRRTRLHEPAHHVQVPLPNAIEHVDDRQAGRRPSPPAGRARWGGSASTDGPPRAPHQGGGRRRRGLGAVVHGHGETLAPVDVADPPPPVPGSPPGVPVSTVVSPGCPGRAQDRSTRATLTCLTTLVRRWSSTVSTAGRLRWRRRSTPRRKSEHHHSHGGHDPSRRHGLHDHGPHGHGSHGHGPHGRSSRRHPRSRGSGALTTNDHDPRHKTSSSLENEDPRRAVLCGMTQDSLSIGDVATRTGVEQSALRFYEAEGLIGAQRTAGGQRRFARDVLRRIAFIRVAQRVGLSLGEIRDALSNAARPSNADTTGLGQAVEVVAFPPRRTDRRARATPRQPHVLHRMRLPVTRRVCPLQPARPCVDTRRRTAIPARQHAGRYRRGPAQGPDVVSADAAGSTGTFPRMDPTTRRAHGGRRDRRRCRRDRRRPERPRGCEPARRRRMGHGPARGERRTGRRRPHGRGHGARLPQRSLQRVLPTGGRIAGDPIAAARGRRSPVDARADGVGPSPTDGPAAVLHRDIERTAASLELGAPGDGDRYRRIIEDWLRVSGPFVDALLTPFPPLRASARLDRRRPAV